MKRVVGILAFLLCFLNGYSQDFKRLDSLLTQFYDAMLSAGNDEKNAEFDFLIQSCKDTSTRRHVALEVFDHYRDSKLMGEEEVAIHIYDRWFSDGTLRMRGESDKLEAQLFSDFNRSTLIGREAPVINLTDPRNRLVRIPEQNVTNIFFFYDTACANCRLQSELLPKVLKEIRFKCTFNVIYCGSDAKSWRKFRKKFKVNNKSVSVIHLWDPEISSDYLKLYGIISTPRIYVSEPTGTIIGRRLDAESLMEMLPVIETIATAYEKTKEH